MAEAAALKLNLALDLQFFRQQLQKAQTIAASEFNPSLNIRFSKQSITREMGALQRLIDQRKFEVRLEVNDTSVKVAAANLTKLNKSIATFRQSQAQNPLIIKIKYQEEGLPGGITGQTRAQKKAAAAGASSVIDQATYKDLQNLYRLASAAQLPFEKLARGAASSAADLRRVLKPAFAGIGDDVKNGLEQGLASASSDISKIAAAISKDLLAAFKRELGIASPSKKTREIGDNTAKGFEDGLTDGLSDATRLGVQQLRQLFRELKKEAQSGTAQLRAIMLGAMSGVIQLPGQRVQRTQLRQTGGAINAAMTGGALSNIQARQGTTRRQTAAAATATPTFAAALPLMFGMKEGELKARMQGLYGQQYRAPSVQSWKNDKRIASLLNLLGQARSGAGGFGARESVFGARSLTLPGTVSSGYIGRSALSPGFVNYPPGLPAAYASGFAGGAGGRFNLGAAGGPGAGSFVPMEGNSVATVSRFNNQLSALISRISDAGSAIRRELLPSFGDLRQQVIDNSRRISVGAGSRGGILRGEFLGAYGNINAYRGRFPTHGMMTPSGMTADELFRRQYATRLSASGNNTLNSFVNRSGGFSHYAFPMAPMMGPSSSLGRITAQSSMFAGGGGGGAGGGFGGFGGFGGGPGGGGGGGRNAVQQFGRGMMQTQIGPLPNLPGVATIRELRDELGFATKQLILFGSVYKGLAFLQNFPREVMSSVAALQSYRNSLTAVSGSSEAFALNNEYILGLVEKYNIPLDAARQGFVKLYASMAPVGFTGTEIRDLFDAVSKGAATFGMSADKVDRVIYAFGQMASKGQVMSEELKGQLGDVLPGAVAIFAEAAGFKGPAAIAQFSKALEDGEYKGAKMRELLLNVKDVMNKEFGPGAEGAARTFQGALNRMQNSVKFLYEAFEPVAIQVLNTFVVPITNGLKTATEGFNQFFSGIAAPSAGGREFAAQLEALKPAFQGIAANVASLLPQLQQLGGILLEIAKIFIQIAASPIVGFLLRTYAAILPLQIAFNLLRLNALIPLIGSFVQFIGTIPLLISRFGVLMAATTSYNTAVAQGIAPQIAMRTALINTGLGAQQAALGFRAASIAVGLFRTAIGAGLMVGIGLIIQKFAEMKSALDGIAAAARGVSSSLASMSRAGDVAGIRQQASDLQDQLRTFQEIRGYSGKAFGEKEAQRLRDLGLERFIGTKNIFTGQYLIKNNFLESFTNLIDEKIRKIQGNLAEVPQKFREAEARNKREEDQRKKDEAASAAAAAAAAAAAGTETKPGKPKPDTLDSSIATIAKDASEIFADQVKAQFEAAYAKIELNYGRGAGIFQPFVDAYEKLLQFGEKQQEGVAQLMRLQSQGLKQTIAATTREIRNAAKGGMAVYGRPDAMSSQPIAGGQPFRPGDSISGANAGIPQGRINGTGQRFGPSAAEIEAQNEIQNQARQAAIAASLSKEAAIVFNAFRELNIKDITSKANQDLFDLGEAFKKLKRDAEDAWDSMRPESAVSDFMLNTTKLKRELQDVDDSFRSIQKSIAESARGQGIAQLFGTKEFLDSYYVKQLSDSLSTLGVPQEDINELFKAGSESGEKFKRKLEEIATALPKLRAEIIALIMAKQDLNTEFGLPIALLREKAKGLSAFGLPIREEENKIKEIEIAEQLVKAEATLAKARADGASPKILAANQAVIDSLKMQKAATMELIPGVATLGETMALAFDPALNAFTDFIMGTKSAGEAFRQFAYEVVSGLAKMAAQAAMTAVFKSVLGGISSMFGFADGGVAQGGIQAFANGGIATGGIKFQAFAGGGTVSGPTLGLMGEGKYNEAIVPLPNGRSIPVDMKNNGGGDNFNINVSVDAKGSKVQGDDQRGNQLATAISAAVQEELLKQKRPGGLLA